MEEENSIVIEGSAAEKFVVTTSGELDWIEEDTIIVGDEDYLLSKRMGNRVLKALAVTAKLSKLISDNGENHAQFKRIFGTICAAENVPIVLKVRQDEVVGVLDSNVYRLLNTSFVSRVIPHLNASRHLEQVFLRNEDDASVAVYINKNLHPITFLGKRWIPGATVSYSSTGLFGPSVAPTLVPMREDFSFGGLVTSLEEVVVPMLSSEFESKQVVQAALDASDHCVTMIKRWEFASNKELSVGEYEKLLKAHLDNGDTNSEMIMLERFSKIRSAHKITEDDSRLKNKIWKATASSGTTLGELAEVITDISVSFEKLGEPAFELTEILDSNKFDLDDMANNNKANEELNRLSWSF